MARSILVVDDELSIRQSLKGALGDEGFEVQLAESGIKALSLIENVRPDIILLDIWMPELDGIETLRRIVQAYPDQNVIMMSGHGTIETAVKATKLGAFDFIEKPLSLEKLLVLIQNAGTKQDLTRENQALRKQIQTTKVLIGESQAIATIKEKIRRVGPTTGSVLITGENGTGKELVAHSIHAVSKRFNKPFIEVNCAAIPEELIESELFGHERGAFTGALQLRRGKFDLAHEGTLFLDEIGDMSLKTQAKILRILQEQRFERVGGSQTIAVDVRIIAATNKDLKHEIKQGTFREDLYYRLNVVPFHIPPLRERQEDIPLLSQHFMNEFSRSHQKAIRLFQSQAMELLKTYDWPGNVRELKNLVERILILSPESQDGLPISAPELHSYLDGTSIESVSMQPRNLKDAKTEFEKEMIARTLKETQGNISKAAAILGVERSHLHKKMKLLGLDGAEGH